MVWKILSILAAGCLGASCYFAWSNQKDLATERDRESSAKANLKSSQERKKEGDEALVVKKTALETVQKDLATAKDETVKFAAQVQEKEVSHGVIKGNLDQVQQQVTAVEKQIDDAGDIEKLIAQIEKLKKDQAEAESAVANQAQRFAAAQEAFTSLTAQTAKLREDETRGRRGIVAPEFTARVSQYFPEWDVAILNKGNTGGVFANADLEVKRGKNVIAKLKVKNVEQFGSVAEVVPGSIASGQAIQAGDTVVAAATQSASTPPPPPAPTGGSAPAPGAAPAAPAAPAASDPFGAAPAAAPAAPAMSDPFGAAPAPAPAPAAPAADPFGAAPAPAPAPAAPAADPFGAAPAPAPGTAAKPNTADPFAPAPKP
ncbi:hypothetical protein [Brevifollis gellanilyticus]|uniref:Uncharacterized protein n=1 Tax=Brevifollis gellanilyticus TaxID=748831 RepID=A0A512M6L3_9BACT|nr:hypothetical protein [Brevifollis gellanilyticus]GEP42364.1 hypothetical protein BGE01nite_16550 [Brevifollis gellanilyticus]